MRANRPLAQSCLKLILPTLLVLVPVWVTPAAAQNHEILDQRLDASRHGYTVIRLRGSHYEMGYGMGAALAEDVEIAIGEIKGFADADYTLFRAFVESALWLPAGIEEEIDGLVDGVHAVLPSATVDAMDVKVLNTASEWLYLGGCRSHACWGSFVQAPVRSLATRRLDFGTPFGHTLHHVVSAWDPDDGSVRWVNLAWPGYVNVVTGVNVYGTLVSLHDYNTSATADPGLIARSGAARIVLTGMSAGPVDGHLAWAEQTLAGLGFVSGTFLNYYAPEGYGGVLTCVTGGSCGAPRVPQTDYFGGDVLITTNSQTDGHSMPIGGGFMHDYYAAGGLKDLASHFELMGTTGLHLLSVEYRSEANMTLWAHGRGRTDRLELEWQYLFENTAPGGGVPRPDADPDEDAGPDNGAPADNGGGCGCTTTPAGAPWCSLVPVILLLVIIQHRRRSSRPELPRCGPEEDHETLS
jgi:MYXO-CTERM domain-containing protein